MAMTLYHGEPNGPSLTVLAALFETGHEAELKAIDLTKGERHGSDVPRSVEVDMSIEGEGPVLVADGEPMADAVFVARYLNDAAETSPIVPTDPYARWEMMTWCRQIIERTAPAAAYLGVKATLADKLAVMGEDGFNAMIAPIRSEDLKARWIAARAGDFEDDKLEDSHAKIKAALEKIESQLKDGRDWLFGAFSIADLETYAWTAGMRGIVPEAFENKSRTAAWLGRMQARRSVARALSLAKSAAPQSVWAPGPEINRWG
ncbi:glutathione S-transferase family protein [Hyphococcus luteus]|uniref:Glutathione S-transferase family protein n=1 Tax=Hyphococcus luteus TaxID=2058213 RepID=A0A2S7K3C9_9PROT|nr:glutathione S-transferase C-terminal domain-containing protein [Marinicaulis flavus]PQA86948.1 glutathione S-transferase family protein [Marinicaulis flavus]